MDFLTIEQKLESFSYHTFDAFRRDMELVAMNSMVYNQPDTFYYKHGERLHQLIEAACVKYQDKIAAMDPNTGNIKVEFKQTVFEHCDVEEQVEELKRQIQEEEVRLGLMKERVVREEEEKVNEVGVEEKKEEEKNEELVEEIQVELEKKKAGSRKSSPKQKRKAAMEMTSAKKIKVILIPSALLNANCIRKRRKRSSLKNLPRSNLSRCRLTNPFRKRRVPRVKRRASK